MKTKITYRKPIGKQVHFIISTTYKRTKNARRSLELLKSMYVNLVNFNRASEKETYELATACEEFAIEGAFKNQSLIEQMRFAVDRKDVVSTAKCKAITVSDAVLSPEELRMKVYAAILQGAKGIEYQSLLDDKEWILYHYIKELNYRITQYGRTLMALKPMGIFCAKDVLACYPELENVARPISESEVLAEQELPDGLMIGEFKDAKGERYLMIQNMDIEDKSTKAYAFQLKKNFRVYRVSPHDGKQMLSKENINQQKILIMPGDADFLRYQNVEEEACFIEYALKK